MKPTRQAIHGVLLLDKPLGLTSQNAVWRVRKALGAQKAGHSGTLDPLATGLLPVCLGAATKFAQANLEADKTYQVGITLGQTRVGGDLEGEVIQERRVNVTGEQLQQAIRAFTGPISQVPPMQSALKHQGKPLYAYARAGQTVERMARQVVIHRLTLLSREGPILQLQVHCSKGTYIRTLGEDIGQALGCGAYLASLRRTQSGAFDQTDCVSLDAFEQAQERQREGYLLPVASLLKGYEPITLGQADAGRFLSGLRRRGDWPDHPRVVVFGDQPHTLLGTAHVQSGELIPDRLLNPQEIQSMIESAA